MRSAAIAPDVDDRGIAHFQKCHRAVVGKTAFVVGPIETVDAQISDVAGQDFIFRQAVVIANRLPAPQGQLPRIALLPTIAAAYPTGSTTSDRCLSFVTSRKSLVTRSAKAIGSSTPYWPLRCAAF